MMTTGKCLCGEVVYQADIDGLNYYQCHCSLCQRQSGTASNCGTLLELDKFQWLQGESARRTWRKPSGFSSAFCTHCGAPVPNQVHGTALMFIPVGSLQHAPGQIVAHLFLDSRADWDTAALQGRCFDTMPAFDEMVRLLRAG